MKYRFTFEAIMKYGDDSCETFIASVVETSLDLAVEEITRVLGGDRDCELGNLLKVEQV